jgi:hypothetical protein
MGAWRDEGAQEAEVTRREVLHFVGQHGAVGEGHLVLLDEEAGLADDVGPLHLALLIEEFAVALEVGVEGGQRPRRGHEIEGRGIAELLRRCQPVLDDDAVLRQRLTEDLARERRQRLLRLVLRLPPDGRGRPHAAQRPRSGSGSASTQVRWRRRDAFVPRRRQCSWRRLEISRDRGTTPIPCQRWHARATSGAGRGASVEAAVTPCVLFVLRTGRRRGLSGWA